MTCFKNTFLKPDIGKAWMDEEGFSALSSDSEASFELPNSEFWDKRYDTEELVYGENPNVFFEQELNKIKPGRILLPGEGEGRNAVFAASKGWEVHAIDSSTVAKKKALSLAAKKGVEIQYYTSDILQMDLKDDYFDAIGLIYVHLPGFLRRAWHRKLLSSLKSGGILILEGFEKEQIGFSSGGPKDVQMLFDIEDLKKDFESLQISFAEKTELVLKEGPGHDGEARVVRLVGVKQ
jgi:hypothetical protein